MGKLKKGGLCAFSEGSIQFASWRKQREELLGALVRLRQANKRSGGRGTQDSPAAPGDVHTPTARHWEPSLQGLPQAKPISRAESSLKVPWGDPNLFSEKLGSATPSGLLLMPDGPGGEPGSPCLPPGQVRAGRTHSQKRKPAEVTAGRGHSRRQSAGWFPGHLRDAGGDLWESKQPGGSQAVPSAWLEPEPYPSRAPWRGLLGGQDHMAQVTLCWASYQTPKTEPVTVDCPPVASPVPPFSGQSRSCCSPPYLAGKNGHVLGAGRRLR